MAIKVTFLGTWSGRRKLTDCCKLSSDSVYVPWHAHTPDDLKYIEPGVIEHDFNPSTGRQRRADEFKANLVRIVGITRPARTM